MTDKTITTRGKELLSYMRSHGLDEYGSVIVGNDMRSIIGIKEPERSTKSVFNALALQELSITDYVRNILLGEGKALVQAKGDYRILLPSENTGYILRYISAADGKLRRAKKLGNSMPDVNCNIDDTLTKIACKQQQSKRQKKRRNDLS